MNARITDLTLGQAAQRLGRYRPLVLTVVVTLGVLRVLPEDGTSVEEALAPTASATAIPSVSPAAEPPTGATPDPPSSPDAGSGIRLPRLSPSVPAARRASSAPTTSATTPMPAASKPPSSARRAATTPTILQTGWASRMAGTPAETVGVPDGSLPVGNRVGQTDKASFLRLGGHWQSLGLAVDPDGTAGIGEATVQACAITTAAWEPLAPSSFEDAPEWDPDDCVAGVAGPAGREWTFDIDGIDQRFGVALVPGPDAAVEFQIAFRASP